MRADPSGDLHKRELPEASEERHPRRWIREHLGGFVCERFSIPRVEDRVDGIRSRQPPCERRHRALRAHCRFPFPNQNLRKAREPQKDHQLQQDELAEVSCRQHQIRGAKLLLAAACLPGELRIW